MLKGIQTRCSCVYTNSIAKCHRIVSHHFQMSLVWLDCVFYAWGRVIVSNFREYKFYLNSEWKFASILWRVICMISDWFLEIVEHLKKIVKKWKKDCFSNETQNHPFKRRTKYQQQKTHQFRMNNNPNIKWMWTSNLNEWMNIIQNVNSSVSIEKHQSHSRFEL